jgi:hypothetical protein
MVSVVVILKSPSRPDVKPFPFSLKITFTKGNGSLVSESNIFPFKVAWEKERVVSNAKSKKEIVFLNIIFNTFVTVVYQKRYQDIIKSE